MKYYLETKTGLREATPEECYMIWWHLEVGEELHLDGYKVYDENFEKPSYRTTNSIWSKVSTFFQGYAQPGKECIWPSPLYEKFMAASNKGKELFMKWIHKEYEAPEEVQNMRGWDKAMWVLNH